MSTKSNKSPLSVRPRFEFRWENFRSFRDTDWIQVRPITILIGPNNSGKTSLLLPLLLMKQTLESKDPDISLKTTGPIVGVGTFRDFVFRHRAEEAVTFRLRFRYPKRGRNREELQRIGAYPPGQVSIEFRRGAVPAETKLHRLRILDIYGRLYLTRTLLESGRYSLRFVEDLAKRYAQALSATKPNHFLFSAFGPLFELITKEQRERRKKLRKEVGGSAREGPFTLPNNIRHYFAVMSATEDGVKNLLSSFSYVGPLRDYPKRFYESTEEVPESVGSDGGKAPHILFLKKSPAFVRKVRRWVQAFGLADRILCRRLFRGVFSLEIAGAKRGTRVDFADTGFGLSQLLPLIVEGFHANTEDIIFMEQPEIHLNPRLQCGLANLLCAIAKDKKTVIVETHSEHLVLRLRSLIAERELSPDDVALYFVEKRRMESTVRQIAIGDDGHIERSEWPKGFFEDSIGEALRLARTQSPSEAG